MRRKDIGELLLEKENIIEKSFCQRPFEAIGVSKEKYEKWKIHTRYARLCEVIRCNGKMQDKPKEGLKYDIDNFRKFLHVASINERETLVSLMSEVLSKADERALLKQQIELKKRELAELEKKYTKV